MKEGLRVTVWNEGVHEKRDAAVQKLYPKGMGWQIAQYLKKQPGIASVKVAQLDDPAVNAAVDAANAELDRAKQASMWQAINKQSAEEMWHIPTFFGLSQTIAGTKVGPVYRWSAYGSWPYGEMYVTD